MLEISVEVYTWQYKIDVLIVHQIHIDNAISTPLF
jgi:hypothetical protein